MQLKSMDIQIQRTYCFLMTFSFLKTKVLFQKTSTKKVYQLRTLDTNVWLERPQQMRSPRRVKNLLFFLSIMVQQSPSLYGMPMLGTMLMSYIVKFSPSFGQLVSKRRLNLNLISQFLRLTASILLSRSRKTDFSLVSSYFQKEEFYWLKDSKTKETTMIILQIMIDYYNQLKFRMNEHLRGGFSEEPIKHQRTCLSPNQGKSICYGVQCTLKYTLFCRLLECETCSKVHTNCFEFIEVSRLAEMIRENSNNATKLQYLKEEIKDLKMKLRVVEEELKKHKVQSLTISGLYYRDIVGQMRKIQPKKITNLTIRRTLVWKWNEGVLFATVDQLIDWETQEWQGWRALGKKLFQFKNLTTLQICFNHYLFNCEWFNSWVHSFNKMKQLKTINLFIWEERKKEQMQNNWTVKLNKRIKVNIIYGPRIQ